MNVRAVDPTTTALTAAAANAPAKKAAPAAAAPAAAAAAHVPSAPVATPAVKVAISGVPATVKAEDRALYMQILKSVGGNVNAALAGLAAAEAKESAS